MAARIYKPAKTAMQQGNAATRDWILEYEPEQPLTIEPLMGGPALPTPSRKSACASPPKRKRSLTRRVAALPSALRSRKRLA
jgi:hypothetical protein